MPYVLDRLRQYFFLRVVLPNKGRLGMSILQLGTAVLLPFFFYSTLLPKIINSTIIYRLIPYILPMVFIFHPEFCPIVSRQRISPCATSSRYILYIQTQRYAGPHAINFRIASVKLESVKLAISNCLMHCRIVMFVIYVDVLCACYIQYVPHTVRTHVRVDQSKSLLCQA